MDGNKKKHFFECRKLFLYKSLISLLHLLIIAHTFIYWEITKKNSTLWNLSKNFDEDELYKVMLRVCVVGEAQDIQILNIIKVDGMTMGNKNE